MEANMNLRIMTLPIENQSSKSPNLRIIGSIALLAVLIAAVYALAVQFPIGPDELATFAFPP
jgi:hypothetical protein